MSFQFRRAGVWISALALSILFITPYALLGWPHLPTSMDLPEVALALQESFMQAILSVALVFMVGGLLCLGLFGIPQRIRKILEFFLFLPSLLPSLAIILLFLQVIENFPFGLWGIVMVQTFIYSGLFAVLLFHLIEEQGTSLFDLAELLAISRWKFLWILFVSLRSHLGLLLLPIFGSVWSSFSLPFVLGGGKSRNLELVIYESLRLDENLSLASSMSWIQALLFGGIAFLILKRGDAILNLARTHTFGLTSFYRWRFFQILLLVYVSFFIGASFYPLPESLRKLLLLPQLSEVLTSKIFGTLGVSLGVGLMSFFIFTICLFSLLLRGMERWALWWGGFGVSVLGVGIWKLGGGLHPFFFFFVGFSLLVFASLYRMEFLPAWRALMPEIERASIYLDSDLEIFRWIAWPRMRPTLWKISAWSALWASGDFALSRYLFSGDVALAPLAQTLTNAYRIDEGFGVLAIQMILGLLIFSVFWLLSYVDHRKLLS